MQENIGTVFDLQFGYFDQVNPWSTQLTKSNTVPKAVTQKTTMPIFTLDMPTTNTVVSVFRVWPQIAHSVIIITLLLAGFYYYGSDFGSPRALQCSMGYD